MENQPKPRNAVRSILESAGLTRSELARASQLSPRTISRVIGSKNQPKLDTKRRITAALSELTGKTYRVVDVFVGDDDDDVDTSP